MKELTDLPPGVIGFETTGWIHARHYRDVVEPAVHRAALDGDVRCVVVIDDFAGMTPSALWRDLTMALGNLRAWNRIALVTDITWLSCTTALFGWLTPGTLKRFSRTDRAAAITWAAATPAPSPSPSPSADAADSPAAAPASPAEPPQPS